MIPCDKSATTTASTTSSSQ